MKDSKIFNSIQKEYDELFDQILYRRACVSPYAGAMGNFAMLGRNNPDCEFIYTGRTEFTYQDAFKRWRK